jgi:hypothetical protein
MKVDQKTIIKTATEAIKNSTKKEFIGDFVKISQNKNKTLEVFFEVKQPGYTGWLWDVNLDALKSKDDITVNEVNMIANKDALVAKKISPHLKKGVTKTRGREKMIVDDFVIAGEIKNP